MKKTKTHSDQLENQYKELEIKFKHEMEKKEKSMREHNDNLTHQLKSKQAEMQEMIAAKLKTKIKTNYGDAKKVLKNIGGRDYSFHGF